MCKDTIITVVCYRTVENGHTAIGRASELLSALAPDKVTPKMLLQGLNSGLRSVPDIEI